MPFYIGIFTILELSLWAVLANHLASVDTGPKGGIPSLAILVLGTFYIPSFLFGITAICVLAYFLRQRKKSLHFIVFPALLIPIGLTYALLQWYSRAA
jgi:hypothetical protein